MPPSHRSTFDSYTTALHDLEANLDGREGLSDPSESESSIGASKSRRIPRPGIHQGLKAAASEGLEKKPALSQDQNSPSNQADFRAQFYEYYRKEADEYDKEFMKKHEEDLNTTLIFAGLFSAVTSAFIIQVHTQLPDPNEQTAALLRFLIYTINNTALGGDIPTVPPQSPPLPQSLVRVQILLYASLVTSLFSAFLAMLGKQWLNRYASIDMRGSVVERSQNRQRKLNGIVTWYFDYVMESLPLMLQVSLLLLGCALSTYLWHIKVVIAAVVIGVTTFGATFYAFIVVAGAVFESCPYQTPSALFLRFLWNKIPSRSVLFPTKLPTAQQSGTQPDTAQTFDGEVTALDFRCISWMLRTSLDRSINESTLKFLASILEHPGLNDGIVADCLNVLIGCINVTDDDRVVVTRGSEQLAEMAATCHLRSLSHLLVEQPSLKIPKGLHQRYKRAFPSMAKLHDLPFHRTIAAAHNLIVNNSPDLDLDVVDPSTPETLWLAHNFVKIAWHQKKSGLKNQNKVDDWILHFSHHCLLRGPDPPLSIIADCLSIAAIELGCNVSRGDVMSQDKSAHIWDIVSDISLALQWMSENPDTIQTNREPIATLLLGATWLERVSEQFDGQPHHALRQFLDRLIQVHRSDPGLGVVYLDVLLYYINVDGNRVTGRPGSEQAISFASICLLRALSWAGVVVKGMFKHYTSVISPTANFEELRCRHLMGAIHALMGHKERRLDWTGYDPHPPEYISLANALDHAVRVRVSLRGSKVPRWILRFALHSLSQDPLPPTPVVTACLSIIATDLDCEVLSINYPPSKSARLEMISKLILQILGEMVETAQKLGQASENADARSAIIRSKRKAFTALFPYVVLGEKREQNEMFDAFLRLSSAWERSGLMWHRIEPFISALLDEGSPVPSKRAAILISPYIPWWQFKENGGRLIQLLTEAASKDSDTEVVGQSIVDTLLQVACWKSPPIPAGMWSWLNKCPNLPPACSGRYWGSRRSVFRMVRALEDTEILTSYLRVVWSEWDFLMPRGFDEMCVSIEVDFIGQEKSQHRKDLLDRLDHIRRKLELGLWHMRQHKPSLKEENLHRRQVQYAKLEEILRRVDRKAITRPV